MRREVLAPSLSAARPWGHTPRAHVIDEGRRVRKRDPGAREREGRAVRSCAASRVLPRGLVQAATPGEAPRPGGGDGRNAVS